MSVSRPWYIGRLTRRRGVRTPVDVVAIASQEGWDPIEDPRKLFPKLGQVELAGALPGEGSPGEWLVFQVTEEGRPGARQLRIGPHRFVPRFADLKDLRSVEAARFLFTRQGWDGADDPGRWIVRFAEDYALALHLDREQDGRLRCADRSLGKVACMPFEQANVVSQPAAETTQLLYDPANAEPLAVYDWSPDADYVAHVVRALAGANDPRLPELITWLELHRNDMAGRISAIGVDHELAYEALRSGELAARLSADRDVLAAYFATVRDDPGVAAAVAKAIAQEAEIGRCEARAAFERGLVDEKEERQRKLDADLAELRAKREGELQTIMSVREAEALADLDRRLADRQAATVNALDADRAAANAEMARLRKEIDALQVERQSLESAVSALRSDAAIREEAIRAAGAELARLASKVAATEGRAALIARPLTVVPASDGKERIDRAELGRRIASCSLLTAAGKEAMAAFAAYLLAGEVPILEGPDVENFVRVAEALMAAGRLIPFDADTTILTPEDLWSRPGSNLPSQIAQAAGHAAEGRVFLVELRGIERSAARHWHPALVALVRRGMLPRPLLLFATLIDRDAAEAQAIPPGACRMTIERAVVEAAGLAAPTLLSGTVNAIACHVDVGERPDDLSPATAVLTAMPEMKLSIATALRGARIAVEAAALAPEDSDAMLKAARRFCCEIGSVRNDEARGEADRA